MCIIVFTQKSGCTYPKLSRMDTGIPCKDCRPQNSLYCQPLCHISGQAKPDTTVSQCLDYHKNL